MQIRKISHDGREMIDLLFSVMRGEALPLPSPNGSKRDGRLARSSPELRVKAAEMLLDRAYGKAKETVPDAARYAPASSQRRANELAVSADLTSMPPGRERHLVTARFRWHSRLALILLRI
jgi:hypothetical protein